MTFLTTWWFITAVILAVSMIVIYLLQEYYRLNRRLPLIDRLRKAGIHPTIRKPPDSFDLDDEGDNHEPKK